MEAFEAFKKDLETAGFSPVINIDADVNYIVTNLYPEFPQIISRELCSYLMLIRFLLSVNLSEYLRAKR
jgi:hypothetical protein